MNAFKIPIVDTVRESNIARKGVLHMAHVSNISSLL